MRFPDAELLAARSRTSLRARVGRVRAKAWVIGQCAIAAGIAWWLAADVFGHTLPFFAPIAAVVSLGTTYGQRHRRVLEVTVGVALGVLLGDVVTHLIGSGGPQIALIVACGMSIALLLDAGQLLLIQAAVQGIVVAALAPAPGDAILRSSPRRSCPARRCASHATRPRWWCARSPTCCAPAPTGWATATWSSPWPRCGTPGRPTR
jgi:hypothetical protein